MATNDERRLELIDRLEMLPKPVLAKLIADIYLSANLTSAMTAWVLEREGYFDFGVEEGMDISSVLHRA